MNLMVLPLCHCILHQYLSLRHFDRGTGEGVAASFSEYPSELSVMEVAVVAERTKLGRLFHLLMV